MSSAPASSTAANNKQAGKYLTVVLDNEAYGLNVLKIREIIRMQKITPVPQMPAFVKGVINLRGRVIPIVDLRVKLGCEKTDIDSFTVVIVLNVRGRVVGAVVDSVSDVMQLGGDQVKPAPEMASSSVDTTYITGIGNVAGADGSKDRMLILVDIEALMSSAEMGLMEQQQAA